MLADLKEFTRIYRNLAESLYVMKENEKVLRMVRVFRAELDDDSPLLYEEVQGWCEEWEMYLKGDDPVEWMTNRYAHRKGMMDFIDFCVNHNNTVTEHIKYWEED